MNEARHLVLGADAGGSTARLAFSRATTEMWAPARHETLPTAASGSCQEALFELELSRFKGLDVACIALARPVRGDHVRLTNLPWEIDVISVVHQLALPPERRRHTKDLEAIAWVTPTFKKEQLYTLHVGQPGPGNAALLAAGTGLGEAGLVWEKANDHPFASEGGHAEFAPRDDVEWGFARQLMARHGHARWERVVSGPGLLALYRYLLQMRKAMPPREVGERLRAGEGAAVVTEAALKGECAIPAFEFSSRCLSRHGQDAPAFGEVPRASNPRRNGRPARRNRGGLAPGARRPAEEARIAKHPREETWRVT